jgi:hypothetical protein
MEDRMITQGNNGEKKVYEVAMILESEKVKVVVLVADTGQDAVVIAVQGAGEKVVRALVRPFC